MTPEEALEHLEQEARDDSATYPDQTDWTEIAVKVLRSVIEERKIALARGDRLRGLLRDYVAWSEEHPDIWEDYGVPYADGKERIVQCIARLDLVWLEQFEDRCRALLAQSEE